MKVSDGFVVLYQATSKLHRTGASDESPSKSRSKPTSVMAGREVLCDTAEEHMVYTGGLRSIVIHVWRTLRCSCTPPPCISRCRRWRSLCEQGPAQLQTIIVTLVHGNMSTTIIVIDCAQFATTRWPRSEAIEVKQVRKEVLG